MSQFAPTLYLAGIIPNKNICSTLKSQKHLLPLYLSMTIDLNFIPKFDIIVKLIGHAIKLIL